MIENRVSLAALFSTVVVSHFLSACAPHSPKNLPEIKSSQIQDGSIIGGTEMKKGDLLQTSTVAVYDFNEGQLCTGSLITNNIVVTAAHCIGTKPEQMAVIFDINLQQDSERRMAEKIEVSPHWASFQNGEKNTGDIALIRFKGTLPAGYRPAKILTQADVKALEKGKEVTIAGFGMSDGITGDGAGILRTTSLTIEDTNYSYSEILLNQTQGKAACHGDSGGPAFIKVRGENLLWGVTSRGINDKNNDCTTAVAYTNLLAYKGWIERMRVRMNTSLIIPSLVR